MYSRFFTVSTLLLAATGHVQAQSALTPTDVVAAVEEVTSQSANTNEVASGITMNNIFQLAPKLVDGFKQITTTVTKDIQNMGANPPTEVFAEDGQLMICDSFRDFVKVHQQLLATVIGKHGIMSSFGYAAPVAAVLRTLEEGVDTLAFGIIDLVPTCADGAKSDQASLDKSLGDAITVYSS